MKPQQFFALLLSTLMLLPLLAHSQSDAAAAPSLAVQIQNRISLVPGLEQVQVSEQGGVVRLEGSVIKADNRDIAATLAQDMDGVIAVQNRLRLSPSLQQRMDAALHDGLERSWRFVLFLPLLLVAFGIVWAFFFVGRWLAGRSWLRLAGSEQNPYLGNLMRRSVQGILSLIGVLIALDLLGASKLAGALMGSAGLMGLAVGFAFRDIVENYLAGILLSLRRPFAPRDFVRIDSYEGKVIALNARTTVLMTLEGTELQLPNALVFKAVMFNYSRNDKRRFDFILSIARGASIRDAQTLALQEIKQVPGVLQDPAPNWWVEKDTPAGTELKFLAWVDQTQHDYLKVRSECIRRIKISYAESGVDTATTTYNIVSRTPSSSPAAAEEKHSHDDNRADDTIDKQIEDYEEKQALDNSTKKA